MRMELTIQNLEIEYEVEVPTIPGYLTVAQVAERLGVSKGRVRQFLAWGDLPSEIFGNMRVIPEVAVEEFEQKPRKAGWPKGRPRKTGGES